MKRENQTTTTMRNFAKGMLGFGGFIVSIGLYASGCSVDDFFEINETKIKNTIGECEANSPSGCSTVCTSNGDCISDECGDEYCDAQGACKRIAKNEGMGLQSNDPKECSKVVCQSGAKITVLQERGENCLIEVTNVCNDDGECVDCVEDKNCFSGKRCKNEKCVECSTLDLDCAAGKYCRDGNCIPLQSVDSFCMANGECASGICENGKCAECTPADLSRCGSGMQWRCFDGHCTSCSNGKPDGDEAGIDCGGMCPKQCNGAICNANNECKSGNCVDEICCNIACTQPCYSCTRVDAPGICTPVDPGEPGGCKDTDKNLFTVPGCDTMHECQQSGGNNEGCVLHPEKCLSGTCNVICTP